MTNRTTEREESIIRQACAQLGYRFERLNHDIRMVIDGPRQICFKPGHLPLNTHAACALTSDKISSDILLCKAGIGAPRQWAIPLSMKADEITDEEHQAVLDEAIHTLGFPLFVKPATGSLGHLARRINNIGQLIQHLQLMSRCYNHALIQQHIQGDEYRLFYLNGRLRFAYKRRLPQITGDGILSLNQQIERMKQRLPTFEPEHGLDKAWISEQLVARKLCWDDPLPAGFNIQLSACANLNCGGEPVDFTTTVTPSCLAWLNRLAEIFNLCVFAVDIFSNDGLYNPQSFRLIDINSHPQMNSLLYFDRETLAGEIWRDILRLSMKH